MSKKRSSSLSADELSTVKEHGLSVVEEETSNKDKEEYEYYVSGVNPVIINGNTYTPGQVVKEDSIPQHLFEANAVSRRKK